MDIWGDSGPEVSEGYWQAILNQGEVAHSHFSSEEDETDNYWRAIPNAPTDLDNNKAPNGAWAQAQDLLDRGKVIQLEVSGYNRGGLLVEWKDLSGFVPASHLLDLASNLNEEERRAELAQYVGSSLSLKVIELDVLEKRFILSERATVEQETSQETLLRQITPGETRQGTVTNLCDFGAFVDLGGVEGLIHISELSWGRIDHPSDVLSPGQGIDVYVLNVDPENGRVGLSLKRLQPDPWAGVKDRYSAGQLIEGTVTNIVNFGAFVRIEEGLEGLIHVSELAEGNFLHPRNVICEGDNIVARVLNVDGQRRRIALSLRQVEK